MKKIYILSLLILILSSKLLSQSQNFGQLGSEWYYSENAGGGCSGNCEYVHFKSVLDTIIQGKTTHKIEQTYYTMYGDTINLSPLYVYNQGDTAFNFNFSKSRFLTLLIFNGNQGDTLTLDVPPMYQNLPNISTDTTYRLVIDTVINTTIDGIPLKKYRTIALDDYQFFAADFIDKIGGFDWLFPRGPIFPEAGGPIRCYSDAQIDTNFQTITCDYVLTTAIKEQNNKFDIEIYPNPVSDFLTINTNYSVDRIELYDITGKLVMTTDELIFDLSHLVNGEYIIKLFFETGERIENKIIKN